MAISKVGLGPAERLLFAPPQEPFEGRELLPGQPSETRHTITPHDRMRASFPFHELPQEMFHEILSYIPMTQWSRLRLVCKTFRQKVDNEGLFSKIHAIWEQARGTSHADDVSWENGRLVKDSIFYRALFHQRVFIDLAEIALEVAPEQVEHGEALNLAIAPFAEEEEQVDDEEPMDLALEDEAVNIAIENDEQKLKRLCKAQFQPLPFIARKISKRFNRTIKNFEMVNLDIKFPEDVWAIPGVKKALRDVTYCFLDRVQVSDFKGITKNIGLREVSHLQRLEVIFSRELEPEARLDFTHLSKLQALKADFYETSPWSAEDVQALSALTSLRRFISLTPMHVTEEAARILSALPLKEVKLCLQDRGGLDVRYFEHLHQIKWPHLRAFQFFGEIIPHDRAVDGSPLDRAIDQFLVSHPDLKRLEITALPVSDAALAHLPQTLEHLNISDTRISLEGLKRIKDLPHLKTLHACALTVDYSQFMLLFQNREGFKLIVEPPEELQAANGVDLHQHNPEEIFEDVL